MVDLEKLEKGLRMHSDENGDCEKCPYFQDYMRLNRICFGLSLAADALEIVQEYKILKEKPTARLMTVDEVMQWVEKAKNDERDPIFTEWRDGTTFWVSIDLIGKCVIDGECRAWTGRPTLEQMKGATWDEVR